MVCTVDRRMCVCIGKDLFLNLEFLLTQCTSPTPYVRRKNHFGKSMRHLVKGLERTNVVVDVPFS